jgi:hypothetical protein
MGELPSEEELGRMDGIVITGSGILLPHVCILDLKGV